MAIIKLTKMKTIPAVAVPPRESKKDVPEEKLAPATVRKAASKKRAPEQESISASEEVPEEAPAENNDGEFLSLEKVKKEWPRVLERIREKKISAEAYLREGEPTKVSEKMLTVTFSAEFKFHKESIERNETRRIIEGVLRDVFQHDLMIRPVLGKVSAPGRENTTRSEAQSSKDDELNKLLEEEPLIKTALDTFRARVVKVKKKED